VGDACDKPAGCGWGNRELQYYADKRLKNSRVENDNLIIEVHNEKFGTRDYSSARLVSKGKGDWKYGRIETRAQLPKGKGIWSAIWMLSSENTYKGWPASGEIDIMENVGHEPDLIKATSHTEAFNHMKGNQKGGSLTVPGATETFHDYILEWEEDEYRVYVDEKLIFTFENEYTGFESWPFDQKFHMILNIAYGGNLGGKEGIDPGSLPARMLIDYVRVYQKNVEKKKED
jgi:beta-glucanase (GH16 family)